MNRRKLLLSLSSAFMIPRLGNALQFCPAQDMALGTCSAMLNPERFAYLSVPSQQRNSQWCWAACIEMVCRWHGVRLSQESIVKRVYGGLKNMPADDHALTRALNSMWTSDDGQRFKIAASVFSPALGLSDVSNQRVISDLINDYPLINGARNHATVVARVDYQVAPTGAPIVGRVHVIDPWPGGASPPQYARFLAQDEMNPAQSLRYIASIRIS